MQPSLLMCSPEYFGVRYTINPWMRGQIGQVNFQRAQQQWQDFVAVLEDKAELKFIDPQPDTPDLVFTANAGFVFNGGIVPSRFKHKERQAEEPIFREWFEHQTSEIILLPEGVAFEGAGDALVSPDHNRIWAGYGFRTDFQSHGFLADHFKCPVISLRLTDSRFYHLDTCFCPLLDNQVMYFPQAFDAESRQRIEDTVPPENRIIVSEQDAEQFACNAVLVGRNLFMNHASPELQAKLRDSGYTPVVQSVSEFMKAGGANKCLTISLSGPASRTD